MMLRFAHPGKLHSYPDVIDVVHERVLGAGAPSAIQTRDRPTDGRTPASNESNGADLKSTYDIPSTVPHVSMSIRFFDPPIADTQPALLKL
jgi:hypothetical protein